MLDPTREPASSTSGSSPRAMRWAAAASPTGPAPMMATGSLSFPSFSSISSISSMSDLLSDRAGIVEMSRPKKARSARRSLHAFADLHQDVARAAFGVQEVEDLLERLGIG